MRKVITRITLHLLLGRNDKESNRFDWNVFGGSQSAVPLYIYREGGLDLFLSDSQQLPRD
jgi:hypothetical protein